MSKVKRQIRTPNKTREHLKYLVSEWKAEAKHLEKTAKEHIRKLNVTLAGLAYARESVYQACAEALEEVLKTKEEE